MDLEQIVQKRWSYYQPRFEKLERGGWASWNWAAFFGTLAWLRYRKLYRWSWLYFFVALAIFVTLLYLQATQGSCDRALDPGYKDIYQAVALALFALGWIVPPLIANRVYYDHVRAQAAKTEKAVTGTGSVVGALILQTLIILALMVVVPGITMSHYYYRSLVAEGISLASGAKMPVTEYYMDKKKFPARIEDVAATTSGKYVEKVVLESDGSIRSIFGTSARKLVGRSLVLTPTKKDEAKGLWEWTCSSKDIPLQCLPGACRP